MEKFDYGMVLKGLHGLYIRIYTVYIYGYIHGLYMIFKGSDLNGLSPKKMPKRVVSPGCQFDHELGICFGQRTKTDDLFNLFTIF